MSDQAPEPERAVRDEVHEAPPDASGELPLWAVRAIAFGALVALIAVLGWQAKVRLDPPGPVVETVPDQRVTVTAQRQVRVRVKVDDALPTERVLANGESFEVVGKDRVEVWLPAVEAAKIQYNGEAIVPQGRQDEARRLVFVDDVGS